MGGGVARIAQARAALWLERAWPQLRLVLLLLGAYAGLALLGAFTAFAPGARVGLLLLLIAGLCMLGRRILKTVPWPGEWAAIARLELQSGLPRGLLQLARDVPALEGEPGLWRIGKRLSLAAWARPLRLGVRLDCVTGDRYGFGTAAVLLLALGLLAAGPQAGERLRAAFLPSASLLGDVVLKVRAVPPAYTGRAPIQLTVRGGEAGRIVAPQGSTLRIALSGWRLKATVKTPDGHDLALRDTAIARAGRYTVRSGLLTLAAFEVMQIDDRSPKLRFLAPPRLTASQALEIGWAVDDDFGLDRLSFEIMRGGEARRFPLAVGPGMPQGLAHLDLTPDPWAGQTVRARLVGADQAGQTGVSTEISLRLPERMFQHPLARRIIAARKLLLQSPQRARATVQQQLTAMAEDRAAYGGRYAVYAGLRAAHWRIQYSEDPRGYETAGLLWDIALDLEGGLSSVGDVRKALDSLMGALGRNDGALAAQMKGLEQALSRFLADALRKAMQSPQSAQPSGPVRMLDAGAFDSMLNALRERLAAGDAAGAQEILQALRSVVENLRVANGPQNVAAAEVGRMIAAQQQIARQTTQGQQAAQGMQPAQQGLGQRAAALAQRLPGGEAAGQLRRAAQAMRRAAGQLGQGDGAAAAVAQAKALQALKSAAQSLGQGGEAQARGDPSKGVDPLGRASGQAIGPEFRLPSEQERRAIEDLRRLLEQRAADPGRSADERAYYQRLLKRF